MDHPSLFYVNANEIGYSAEGNKVKVLIKYLYDKQETGSFQEKINEKIAASLLPSLKKEIRPSFQERLVYDYIAQSTEYCHSFSDEKSNYNIIGSLIFGQSVCEGFAKTLKFLCDIIKLPCIVVFGSAIDPDGHNKPHAWNIIKVDEAFYQVDVTWDSIKDGIGRYSYKYFNLTDEEMRKDHTWDITLYPKCHTIIPKPISTMKG